MDHTKPFMHNDRENSKSNEIKHILLVDDDADIRGLLLYNLEREGFVVEEVNNGFDGLERGLSGAFDLIILDLMLPGKNGIEICQSLRKSELTAHTPIIMLTAKSDESDIVLGLGVGADDYVVKPFGVKELIARINARFRRTHDQSGRVPKPTALDGLIKVGDVEIDSRRFQVKIAGEPQVFTVAEFKILESLARSPGIVFTRERLIEEGFGSDVSLVDRNIDVHINAIRKKLGNHRDIIETVRGIGYRFREE